MKYNRAYEDEDFSRYQAYLETIKNKLPEPVYVFASDPRRHDFSADSLHDSWLKSFEFSGDPRTDETTIRLTLINADFDREFRFCFGCVSQFQVSQHLSERYRDLITFEIAVEEDAQQEEKLIFRAEFACGKGEIEIYAGHIEIEEVVIDIVSRD